MCDLWINAKFQTSILHPLDEKIEEDHHVASIVQPQPPNTAPLRRKKKGFGYILNWLKGDQKKNQNDTERNNNNHSIKNMAILRILFNMTFCFVGNDRPQTNGGPMVKVNYIRYEFSQR